MDASERVRGVGTVARRPRHHLPLVDGLIGRVISRGGGGIGRGGASARKALLFLGLWRSTGVNKSAIYASG